ncbi:L,D-transpeptidase family protein [Pontivivens ytuae]|uniref:L,D-transpeptidase family protein n=1 Tax=Pontivivens ytuae TaxID=2789856 RepID=A0A7S9LSZ7_9RHOB|nr:L,D-transpeptidase family protein [Pontivivens ytuae]QPH54574.1 L,D-transpeptidase family protein [Pontivivens ytuae]
MALLSTATPMAGQGQESAIEAPLEASLTAEEAPAPAPEPVWPELAELLQASDSVEIEAFYAARDYAPLFTTPDAAAARALSEAMARQGEHGLPVDTDAIDRIARHVEVAYDGGAAPESELALAEAYLDFVRTRLVGIVQPNALSENIHVFPEDIDAVAELMALAEANQPAQHVLSVAPQRDGYMELVRALRDLRALVASGGWVGEEIPGGGAIELGESDPRVPAIRARLASMGDYTPPEPGTVQPDYTVSSDNDDLPLEGDPGEAANADLGDALPVAASTAEPVDPMTSEVMDPVTEAALKDFQRRHGLNDDGVIGPKTLAALNTTAEERLAQILVNLERVRWTDWNDDERHIYVNMPDYRMWLREGEEEIFTTRVVIGKARHQTVEFSDTMTHMVVNPTWTVPRSIATEEILPQLRENPNYLNENNMSLIDDGTGIWTPEDTSIINWQVFSEDFFPWWIRQGPGPGNALGNVKFMFPNQFAIYLHDTPSRSLFARDARAFSHGCVRVADPRGLAEVLLRAQTADPMALFDRYRATGRETQVNLEQRVPVHLDYRTVWQDEEGVLQFRQDVYGRDALVLDALEAEGVQLLLGQG